MDGAINLLTSFTGVIAKRSEVILVFAVIGVVFMMILPLPTGLVDTLIALNISISCLLVVLAMYLPGPVAFSTFPGLLLITTLFRLALSITTTRLILLQADAGEIVEAFGNFVVGGNLVVGVVIFLILLLVNFLVITKGSERIAEVSARFTLDAMPGKQMSIDADLRAGMLGPEDAKNMRSALAKESQLFGAMDGAMKFVKGDAIAGLIITAVNILGGVAIGTTQMGMTSGEALELFAILTIGDGLVAQIPALLIALTAGLMITRVKADAFAEVNVGQEMASQLTLEPKAWIVASIVMIGFSVIPGMPTVAFVVLAVVFSSVGGIKIFFEKKQTEQALQQEIVPEEEVKEEPIISEEEDIKTLDVYDQVSVLMNSAHRHSSWFLHLRRSIKAARNRIVVEYGYTVPSYKFVFNDQVPMDEYALRFHDVVAVKATFDSVYAWVDMEYKEKLEELEVLCVPGKKERKEDHMLWVHSMFLPTIEENNIPFKSTIDTITEATYETYLRNAHIFIGMDEAHMIMQWGFAGVPELAKECERLLPLSKFADVLKKLAAETIAIKSLKKIFETIVSNAATEKDPNALAEIVRMYLRDQICGKITTDNSLNVCLLDSNTEVLLRESLHKTVTGGYFALDPEDSNKLISEIKTTTEEYMTNKTPVAMVVPQDLRPYFRDLIKGELFKLPVLSYSEISESLSITPIARLSV